jgi:hypothetical protein
MQSETSLTKTPSQLQFKRRSNEFVTKIPQGKLNDFTGFSDKIQTETKNYLNAFNSSPTLGTRNTEPQKNRFETDLNQEDLSQKVKDL